MRQRRIALLGLASLLAAWMLTTLMGQALADPPVKNKGDGLGSPIIIPYLPPPNTPVPCEGCATPAATPITSAFTYQGQLKRGGTPFTGTCDFQFRLYNDGDAGSLPISNPVLQPSLQVNAGHFTATLEYPDYFLTGSERWLGIAVRCPAGSGVFTTLSPRQPLTAAPYALSLKPGARIEGSSLDPLVSAVNQGLWTYGFYGEGGAAGVYGKTDTTSFNTAGVLGEGGLTGVLGMPGYGVHNGNGVVGMAFNGTDAWGVYGETNTGIGVYGQSNTGIGVRGEHRATAEPPGATPAPAIEGRTDSKAGAAFGVLGRVSDTSPGSLSAGVRGLNEGTGGSGIGVWGSQNGDGWGVYGTSRTGYGVYGATTEGGAISVYGRSTGGTGGTGVYGYRAGPGVGVVGQATEGIGVSGFSGGAAGFGGRFSNNDGVALYAENSGQTRNQAALRVTNTEPNGGMAAYLTNNSTYATAHFGNGGTGEVLYLQNGGTNAAGAGGGDFIKAVNEPENDAQFRVLTDGNVRADGTFASPAADFAELLPAKPGLGPGDVLVIGEDGELSLSSQPYQSTVAGVYSTRPGFLGGQPVVGEKAGHIPLAVVGVAPVKATAENGPIRPGDLLTTSSRPGHAMRAGDHPPAGAVLGKALGPLKDGTGVIQMLVVLH